MPDTPYTLRPQRDEAEGYRPVSGLAVAAIALAGLTAVTVIGVWVTAKMRGRPILVPGVLLAAVAGLGLAAAARWQIRRSEGTRTGLGLATTAFWLSLLSLGGYGAYFAATGLAVRQQARDVADQFFRQLSDGKPELAFRLTRPPMQQKGIDPDKPEQIRARFGSTDYFVFDQSDLVRTYRTWGPDRLRIEFNGERDRQDQPDGFQVELNYGLRTPEGQIDVAVTTRGTDDPATGGRDWQILYNRSGFRPDRGYTKLGRLCAELQVECVRRYLQVRWLGELANQPGAEVAAVLRLEGAALPDGQREKVLADLQKPRAINLFPGGGPMRGNALPTLIFSDDGVRLRQHVEVNSAAVDKDEPKIPAVVTVRVINGELEKELLKLAGPGWERQPILPNDPDAQPELEKYGLDNLFRVTELNLRPSQPRVTIGGPGPLTGP
jgi:hypothetical protein